MYNMFSFFTWKKINEIENILYENISAKVVIFNPYLKIIRSRSFTLLLPVQTDSNFVE